MTEYGALNDLDYFDSLDKDIIPPYWIVAACVLVAGVLTIVSGEPGNRRKNLTQRTWSASILALEICR